MSSRQRCLSLDQAKLRQQNAIRTGGYIPERSPRRSPQNSGSPQYYLSTPDILRDSFTGDVPKYSVNEVDICPTPKRLPRPLELQQEHARESRERQRLYSTPKFPRPEDLPDEYLDEFAQPSFYEPSANASLDELMCILATPPSRPQTPSTAQQLEDEAVCQQRTDHRTVTEVASSNAQLLYKIPPLPDDPYDIPPHPKDPNDVVGFIRRARALHRLKELKEAEDAKRLPNAGSRRGMSFAVAGKKAPQIQPKSPVGLTRLRSKKLGLTGLQPKKVVSQTQMPKDVVKKKQAVPLPPERARKLAGLKRRNPTLLPKSKIMPPSQFIATVLGPPPKCVQPPPTYASISERVAAMRVKRKAFDKSIAQLNAEVERNTKRVPPPTRIKPPVIYANIAERTAALGAERKAFDKSIAHIDAEAKSTTKLVEKRAAPRKERAIIARKYEADIGESPLRMDPLLVQKRASEHVARIEQEYIDFLAEERKATAKTIAEELAMDKAAIGILESPSEKRAAIQRIAAAEERLRADADLAALEREICFLPEKEKKQKTAKILKPHFKRLKKILESSLQSRYENVAGEVVKRDGSREICATIETKCDDDIGEEDNLTFEDWERETRGEVILEAQQTEEAAKKLQEELENQASKIKAQISKIKEVRSQGRKIRQKSPAKECEADLSFEDYERETLEGVIFEAQQSKAAAKELQEQLEKQNTKISAQILRIEDIQTQGRKLQQGICDERELFAFEAPPSEVATTKVQEEFETVVADTKERQRVQNRLIQQDKRAVSPHAAEASPVFELPPVIRLFELRKQSEAMRVEASTELDLEEECIMSDYVSDAKQFQDIADWKLENIPGNADICPFTAHTPPARVCPSSFEGTPIETISMPDFGAEDISIAAFLSDKDFDIDEDVDLGEITMPEDGFDEHITMQVLDLEDITAPELDNLSLSVLEGYNPDYPQKCTDKTQDKDLETIEEQQTSPGFLTTVVGAVVDKFRNIFGGTPKDVEDENDTSRLINLDSSLPNMFAATPLPPTPPPTAEESFTIPKYPKEYIAMVKKSQRLYKEHKAKQAVAAETAAKATRGRSKAVERGTLLQPRGRGKLGTQRKQEPPAKIYPPGECSPRHAAEIAKARTIHGYSNISAILNPERAARIAARKAAKEAELAAEEALPPVERMRKRISRLQRKGKRICPKTSVEIIGTLEAIRANMPRPKLISLPKPKWTPVVRRRVDKNIEEEKRVFTKSPTRVFEQVEPMTPLTEESHQEEDLIIFTPLRAHERRLRLQYLKEQAERRKTEEIRGTHHEDSKTIQHLCSPEVAPITYSPIRLQSPSRSYQTENIPQGDSVGEETIREEVTQTSTTENGEVHTATRKVTTKTDEFGNVTCRVEEATGLTGEEDAIIDNIESIEAPEFLNISDIAPPLDPTIPTTSQIIDRIRKQVQEKVNVVLPEICPDTESPEQQRFDTIEFPENLPDEQLYDIDMPEFETTAPHMFPLPAEQSPDISLPYFWNEEIQPKTATPASITVTSSIPSQPLKTKPTESVVVIPTCPKDPKDYRGMVMYARALHRLKQLEETKAAATTQKPVAVKKKPARVPISGRLVKKPLVKEKLKGRTVTKELRKLKVPDLEHPAEPPPLPAHLVKEIARAREIHGYENRTAALNPIVAAKLAAKEAALAQFEALPAHEKVMRRMQNIRQMTPRKRRVQPTADIIGRLEGIKVSMPPAAAEVMRPEISPKLQTPTGTTVLPIEFEEENVTKSKIPEKLSPKPCIAEQNADKTDKEHTAEQSPKVCVSTSLDAFLTENLAALQEKFERRREIPELEDVSQHHSMDEFKNWEEKCVAQQIDADNQAFHQELIEDFCHVNADLGLLNQIAFGEGESSTPLDAKERFRRIVANTHVPCPVPERSTREETFASPSVEYSPIRFFTPTREPRLIKTFHDSGRNILVDLQTPEVAYRVKEFKDLEDMPFDQLEFEDELSFARVSFDKPLTPPPQPSEIIHKIQKEVQERLRLDKAQQRFQDQITTFRTLSFPQHLPAEDLFEFSDPILPHRTLEDTPIIQRSPRISLPYAWGESAPLTPARSPNRAHTSTTRQEAEVAECPKISSTPEDEVYQYPEGYVEMVQKSRALHKLKQQQQAEIAATTKRRGRLITTKTGGKVFKKKDLVLPFKCVKKQEKPVPIEVDDELECPAEPPPLPPEYRADVARTRKMRGYDNTTAALNPEVAAKEAAFAALPEHEKIKVRMERLRNKPRRRQQVQPTMEQLAFIEAMKEGYEYKTPSRMPWASKGHVPLTPRAPEMHLELEDDDFFSIERKVYSPDICPGAPKSPILVDPSDLIQKAAENAANALRTMQMLDSQPQPNVRERFKLLLSQAQKDPEIPRPPTPIQTPLIHYSPIRLDSSPTPPSDIIKEQVIETTETVDGQLQRGTKHVTTTTDPSGNVSSQISESRQWCAKDSPIVEDELEDVEQPSLPDITPTSPRNIPSTKDIIERLRRDAKILPRPDVPMGRLIDLRTPPPVIPLPQDITAEQLLEISCPALSKTTSKSPVQSPRKSPERSPNVSLPQIFAPTPVPPTPPLPPVSPLRYRIHSPEGPIVIPPCPSDPTDYKAMVRMSRKIYELRLQKEAEAKAAAAEAAVIEASKPKKKERVPISRRTEPPPKPLTKRKKLVMRKRAPVGKKLSPAVEIEAEEATAALEDELKHRADAAAFAALPEHEKIKVRMERLRNNSHHRQQVQPTMEQLAFIEAMKEGYEYKTPSRKPCSSKGHVPLTPRAHEMYVEPEDDEFSAIERKVYSPDICPGAPKSPISVDPSDLIQKAAENAANALRTMQMLDSQPQPDVRERFKLLLSQAQKHPEIPIPPTPVQTPLIHYSPICFDSSPAQRAEKSTTQTTRSSDNIIKKQVTETTETVNGQLQRVTRLITTTTDPSGNVSCQISESRPLGAQDTTVAEDELEDVEQPSLPDITPTSPIQLPSTRDIIERIRRDVKTILRQNVLMERPIAPRTPPPAVPLPQNISAEDLLEISCPALSKTPTKSPVQSPVRTPDVSLPQIFAPTPVPPTPPLPPVSPLRYRIHSPEGPIVIPPCPSDPTDYKAMVRMSRKIYELRLEKEAEAKAAAAEAAAVDASKPKKKERVPISKRTGPPPKPLTKRKKLVMRNRAQIEEKKAAAATAAAEARKASECEAERVEALNALPPPLTDYASVTARMAWMKQRGAMQKNQPSLQAAAYLNAVKGAMEISKRAVADEPPEVRYKRILAARARSSPHALEERSMETTSLPSDVHYKPVFLGSPTTEYAYDIQDLQDIDDLEEILEPSFLEESSSHKLATEEFGVSQNVIRRPQVTEQEKIRRYRAHRSRFHSGTPKTSKIQYSTVTSPILENFPAHTSVRLPSTSPFLQNSYMSDIGDISMPYDMGDTQDTDIGDICIMQEEM